MVSRFKFWLCVLGAMAVLVAMYPHSYRYVCMAQSHKKAEIALGVFEAKKTLGAIEKNLGKPDQVVRDNDSITWFYNSCGGFSVFVIADSDTRTIIDVGRVVP